MDVFILAAGIGQRMQPLTLTTPKPLLKVGSQCLIEHHLLALAKAGFEHVVINTSHLGEQIHHRLGDGSRYGLSIVFSHESEGPLETAGGIKNALGLINSDCFVLLSADIYTHYPFENLYERCKGRGKGLLANDQGHLVMVKNPQHHPEGDFIVKNSRIEEILPTTDQRHSRHNTMSYTYSSIALLRKDLFSEDIPKVYPLRPLFTQAIEQQRLTAEIYDGLWIDVGTEQRLALANALHNQTPSS